MSPMPKKRADKHLEIDTVHKGIEEIFDKYRWWWWKPKSSHLDRRPRALHGWDSGPFGSRPAYLKS